MNSLFNLNCTGCPQLLELSVAFKCMTNKSDCTAHPDISSTVSTSPIIDFFSYTFLLTEICSISWSFRRNSFFFCEAFLTLSLTLEIEERDLRDLLFFFLPNHSFMNSHEELKKARKIYSIFWCFLFKAFLTDVLTPTAAIKMYLSNHSFMKVLRHIFMVLFKEILKELWIALKSLISVKNGPFCHSGSK